MTGSEASISAKERLKGAAGGAAGAAVGRRAGDWKAAFLGAGGQGRSESESLSTTRDAQRETRATPFTPPAVEGAARTLDALVGVENLEGIFVVVGKMGGLDRFTVLLLSTSLPDMGRGRLHRQLFSP
jgi:hypothetical protein